MTKSISDWAVCAPIKREPVMPTRSPSGASKSAARWTSSRPSSRSVHVDPGLTRFEPAETGKEKIYNEICNSYILSYKEASDEANIDNVELSDFDD